MTKRLFATLLLLAAGILSLDAATLEHRYAFASDISDSVGSADGSIPSGSRRYPNNAVVSGGALVLDGSSYALLPAGIVSSYADCTIETWVTDYGSGQWARIFDFGSDIYTYMFLSPSSGTGTLRGAIKLSSTGEEITEWMGTRLPTGSQVHVVWTYDAATTTSRLYVEGVMVAENMAATIAPADMGATSNNRLGDSQFSADPGFWGTIEEFRIYDGALTATEVEYNYTAGPDTPPIGPVSIIADPENQSVVEGDTVSFEVAYVGSPPFAVQWYKNSVAVSGATNATYTVDVSLSDNGAVFYAVVSNSDDGTDYNATSASASLTVTADTSAPELLNAACLFPDGVRVLFSEPVSSATALDLTNYSISGLTISAVAFGASESVVILTTEEQTYGATYTLSVSDVQDVSNAANTIASGSEAIFTALPFMTDDIGSPAVASASDWSTGSLSLTAAGSGIGGASDEAAFCHQTYTAILMCRCAWRE